MKIRIFVVLVLFLIICMPGASLSQTSKVVVIPHTETVETPLEPFAPVAADNPPNSDYTIGNDTVTDKVTGLQWQRGDLSGTKTWGEAWDDCQELDLAGKQDWRLPSGFELMSIIDYDAYDPAINTSAFSGTNYGTDDFYWSATPNAHGSGHAWSVFFEHGRVRNTNVSSDPGYARCVRGLPVRDSLFINIGNGTVTDLALGLTWQREGDTRRQGFDAGSYCRGLTLAGGGWRLPTIKELRSIIDNRVNDPAIDGAAFPDTNPSLY